MRLYKALGGGWQPDAERALTNHRSPPAPPMSTPLPTQPVDAPTELSALLGDQAPPPWYCRPALWISVVALLLAGGGLWWWLSSRAASAAPSYSTQAVTRGDLTLTVSANGTIQPRRDPSASAANCRARC